MNFFFPFCQVFLSRLSSFEAVADHAVDCRSSTRRVPDVSHTYINICSTAHPRPRPRFRNKDFIIISSILGLTATVRCVPCLVCR